MAEPGLPPGHWVTIEDQYDHDRHQLGPFPTLEAAAEYCDAYNRAQLKVPAGAPPAAIDRPTDLGVWNVAWCAGYDVDARLRAMLADPALARPTEAEVRAIALFHGARPAHEWQAEAQAAIGATACWCAQLRAGQLPDVTAAVLDAYLALGLEHDRDLFATTQHFGDALLHRCRVCGGAVLHLRIEHEGFGDSIHHYYTPLAAGDLIDLGAGRIGADTCEAWLGARAGLHRIGVRVTPYTGATVGYLAMGHRLDPPDRGE
jgi:hypothetical protein